MSRSLPGDGSPADEARWKRLARDRRWQFRWVAAESPCVAVLWPLSRDEDTMIRVVVAENLAAPPELLGRLARDRSWMVRRAVAQNPQSPCEIQGLLGRDPHREVRLALAGQQAPLMASLFEGFARDRARTVRAAAAASPWCPREVLHRFAQDPSINVRLVARRRLHTTPRAFPRRNPWPPSSSGSWLALLPVLGVLLLWLMHR